jgi:secondary thiamine-phosphate synthase enzyme
MILKLKTDSIFNDISGRVIPDIDSGICVIYSTHTTCGISILEDETLLRRDIEEMLDRFAPQSGIYAHNDILHRDVPPQERLNGFSHIRSILFPVSVVVPVENNKLVLGKWQSIFLIDLDHPRERTVIIKTIK